MCLRKKRNSSHDITIQIDALQDETELTNQGNLKRPREEDDEDGEDDEPDRKRASNSMLGSAGQTGAGVSQEPANAPDDGEGGGGGAADNPPESEVRGFACDHCIAMARGSWSRVFASDALSDGRNSFGINGTGGLGLTISLYARYSP